MKVITACIVLLIAWGSAIGKGDPESTQPIFPQQLTARNLLSYCASSSLSGLGRTRQRYCWGFISGVEETLRLSMQTTMQSVTQKVCVPKGLSSRILARSYVSYAGRRDANLERPAAQVVVEALTNAYPCKA